jgi:hypothetical protein
MNEVHDINENTENRHSGRDSLLCRFFCLNMQEIMPSACLFASVNGGCGAEV